MVVTDASAEALVTRADHDHRFRRRWRSRGSLRLEGERADSDEPGRHRRRLQGAVAGERGRVPQVEQCGQQAPEGDGRAERHTVRIGGRRAQRRGARREHHGLTGERRARGGRERGLRPVERCRGRRGSAGAGSSALALIEVATVCWPGVTRRVIELAGYVVVTEPVGPTARSACCDAAARVLEHLGRTAGAEAGDGRAGW